MGIRVYFILILTALAILVADARSVQAGMGVPHLLPYQGRLTDIDGIPVNTDVTVNFRIYPPSGGCYIYEDTQLVSPNGFGIFSILLGIPGNSTGPANSFINVFNNDVD